MVSFTLRATSDLNMFVVRECLVPRQFSLFASQSMPVDPSTIFLCSIYLIYSTVLVLLVQMFGIIGIIVAEISIGAESGSQGKSPHALITK